MYVNSPHSKARQYYQSLANTAPYNAILEELNFEMKEGNPYLHLDEMIEKILNKIQ